MTVLLDASFREVVTDAPNCGIRVLTCGLFTGAFVYVNLVEHPARMDCRVELAATEFPPSYRRGTIMQVALAEHTTCPMRVRRKRSRSGDDLHILGSRNVATLCWAQRKAEP
jgi:hypothetical protein